MHSPLDWLGPASSIATVAALVVTLLYYLYQWPFHLKKPEGFVATQNNDRIQLVWKPVPRATSYSLHRTRTEDGVVDIYSCLQSHHTDSAVASGSTYEYHVVAEDQGHQSPPSDTVPITVPEKQFVFPPIAPSPPGKDKEEVTSRPDDAPEAQWPVEDLRRVFAELEKRNNRTVLAILGMTSSKPDAPVLFSDVCERAGVTGRQGAAGIGAFTQLINGLGKTKWPFTHHPTPSGQYYKLSPEMAQRWRQVESEPK